MSRTPYGYQILRSDKAIKRIGLDRIMDDDPGSMLRGAYVLNAGIGTLSGSGVSLSNDTEHTLFATTGRKLTITGSGTAPEIRITPASPINAVDYNGTLHINVFVYSSRKNWSGAYTPIISARFGTTINNRSRSISIMVGGTGSNSWIYWHEMGRFFTISIPLSSIMREHDAFDITNISWIGLGLGSFTAYDPEVSTSQWAVGDFVTFDSVIFTNSITPPPNGAVVIHVDDFRKATADIVVPMATAKGVKLTLPVIENTLGTTMEGSIPIGTKAELASAVRAGHGVMCHTNAGSASVGPMLIGKTAAEQRKQMQATQKYLLDFAAEYGVDIGNGWRHQTTHTGFHDSASNEVWADLFDTVCTNRATPGLTEVVRNITGITLTGTDEVVVEYDGADLAAYLYDGRHLLFSGVGGTTGLNGATWAMERLSANTIMLRDTDSSAFSAWTSGGTLRVVSSHVINGVFCDPLQLRRYVLTSQPIENVKAQLLRAKEQKGVLIFYLHDVAASSGDLTTANFEALLDFCIANDIPIWTQEELGNYMRFGTPDYIEAKSGTAAAPDFLSGRGVF